MTEIEHASVEHEQPPDVRTRRYVEIALVIGGLLVVELAFFYGRGYGLRRDVAMAGILGAATLKAMLAVVWFMHLKTDHSFYRQVFVSGVALAVVVFAAAALIMLFGAPS